MLREEELEEVSITPGGILAQLWRKIMFETGMVRKLKTYLDEYVIRETIAGNKPRNKATILSLFKAKEMTWKNFIFLITQILPVVKFRISIELEYLNGRKSVHAIDVTNTFANNMDLEKLDQERIEDGEENNREEHNNDDGNKDNERSTDDAEQSGEVKSI